MSDLRFLWFYRCLDIYNIYIYITYRKINLDQVLTDQVVFVTNTVIRPN